jgi:two-component sensor histidine kinase
MFSSLRSRLAFFLGIAILPLGLIAVQQTVQVLRDTRALEEQDILSRTLRAAALEQRLLREAVGAAQAMGIVAVEIGPATAECDRLMARLVEQSPALIFAGFVLPDGRLACAHDGSRMDFSDAQSWRDFAADPRTTLNTDRAGAVSGQSVLIATVPVFDGGTDALLGAAVVSLPHSITDALLSVQIEGLSLALIDKGGSVLTGSDGIAEAYEFEAFGIVPSAMEVEEEGATRIVVGADGRERLLTLVPLIDRDVFVLGVWDNGTDFYAGPRSGLVTTLFPILMWLAAVAVAFLSLERLVLRHLRALRAKMAGFAPDAPSDSRVTLQDPPAEFAVIAASFNGMVRQIRSDRQALSRNLAEKDLLLREVHHRVKNNLQLIASILNIQIRNLSSGREQRLLRRVQDRVMSLSAVQAALFEGAVTGRTSADRLLETVVFATFKGGLPGGTGVTTRVETVPVMLEADQAVPMVLLAAEAVTNAITHVGLRPDGTAEVAVTLSENDGGEIELRISNSVGIRVIAPSEDVVHGLGARLIEAFAAQLGGSVQTIAGEDRYELILRFVPLRDDAADTGRDTGGPVGLSFYGSKGDGRLSGGPGE